MTKRSKRPETCPANPVIPLVEILPSWMYRDPAEVVERIELQAIAKREVAKRRMHEVGLTPMTVHLMRRLRIKTLARDAMNGESINDC